MKGAITGSIAETNCGVPEEIWQEARSRLSDELAEIVDEFYEIGGSEGRKLP